MLYYLQKQENKIKFEKDGKKLCLEKMKQEKKLKKFLMEWEQMNSFI